MLPMNALNLTKDNEISLNQQWKCIEFGQWLRKESQMGSQISA
jgi:hypothetical protein